MEKRTRLKTTQIQHPIPQLVEEIETEARIPIRQNISRIRGD